MSESTTNTEMLDWLSEQLAKAEKAVVAREQSEDAWREGTGAEWRAAGCALTKAQRLEIAERDARIAVKCRHDVEMLKALISKIES